MKHLVKIGRSLEDVLVDGETHRHRHRHIHHNTLLHYWRGETHNCLTAHYRPVTQETITHSHQSWSSHSLYQLPPSTTIHSILLVQFTCLTVLSTTSLQVLYSIIGRGGRSNKLLSVEDDRTDSPVTTHFRWAFSASTAFVIRVLGYAPCVPHQAPLSTSPPSAVDSYPAATRQHSVAWWRSGQGTGLAPLKVAGLNPGPALSGNKLGQVVHTRVPLSAIWYWSRGGHAL